MWTTWMGSYYDGVECNVAVTHVVQRCRCFLYCGVDNDNCATRDSAPKCWGVRGAAQAGLPPEDRCEKL